MDTYTAEELARRAQRELGANVNARTIYFYRQVGVLSPLESAGSQPAFTERHYLELAAALALRRAPDRPTLEQIAAMLKGLSESELRELAASVPPPAWQRLSAGPPVPDLVGEEGPSRYPGLESAAPAGRTMAGPTMAGPTTAGPTTSNVTVNLAPGVTLFLTPDAPRDLVNRLIEASLEYAKNPNGGNQP